MATVSSLESQANIQQIKNVLSYTVDTHRMAREAVADDVTSESLLQGFEQISSTIEQEKIVLDTLDAHINDLREDPVEESALDQESADFLFWKTSLSRKIESRDNARPARKEQASVDVPLVSHMSVAM